MIPRMYGSLSPRAVRAGLTRRANRELRRIAQEAREREKMYLRKVDWRHTSPGALRREFDASWAERMRTGHV